MIVELLALTSLNVHSLSLRVFLDNSDATWKASVTDVDGDPLCVSIYAHGQHPEE